MKTYTFKNIEFPAEDFGNAIKVIDGSIEVADLSNSNITKLRVNSFRKCENLRTVILPSNIKEISWGSFQECTLLTEIVFPSSTESIGSYSFYGCTSLSNISFEGTVEQWNTIYLGTDWNYNVPATTVKCSDGEVAL